MNDRVRVLALLGSRVLYGMERLGIQSFAKNWLKVYERTSANRDGLPEPFGINR